MIMFSADDPYKILGVTRSADLAEVRHAFREAALRCHPDLCREDPAEAERRFRKLVSAYEAVLEDLEDASGRSAVRGPKTLTPQDFALMDARQYVSVVDGPDRAGRGGPMGSWKHVFPSRNETALFVGFWLAALAMSLLGTWLLYELVLADWAVGQLSDAGVAVLVGGSLAIYAASLAGALALVVLTRKVVWLVFGFRWRRALPNPARGPGLPIPPSTDKLTDSH